MLQKNSFKNPFYEKIKMFKKTHLLLRHLSLLACLTMIAPQSSFEKTIIWTKKSRMGQHEWKESYIVIGLPTKM